MSSKPLISIELRIKKLMVTVVPANTNDRNKDESATRGDKSPSKMFTYEVQTVPPLEDVWTDFSNLGDLFISSVSRIKRIDEMVIPQLKLKRNTLM